jgi:hypothetical protein
MHAYRDLGGKTDVCTTVGRGLIIPLTSLSPVRLEILADDSDVSTFGLNTALVHSHVVARRVGFVRSIATLF